MYTLQDFSVMLSFVSMQTVWIVKISIRPGILQYLKHIHFDEMILFSLSGQFHTAYTVLYKYMQKSWISG